MILKLKFGMISCALTSALAGCATDGTTQAPPASSASQDEVMERLASELHETSAEVAYSVQCVDHGVWCCGDWISNCTFISCCGDDPCTTEYHCGS